MKTLLLALNSKYIHTNLAIRYLKEYSNIHNIDNIEFAEYTINHRLSFVVDEIYRKHPDILLLSCYIWNIEMMRDFAVEFKKVSPNTILIMGGPEVSYNSKQILDENPSISMVLQGEGELAFTDLMLYFNEKLELNQVRSLVYRDNTNEIHTNTAAPPLPMDDLPFPYYDWNDLEHKILYFETIRGCPFHCSYCLSSVTGGVRYLSIEKACERLQIFIDRKVPQVKFVDRTFNCSKKHALSIWRYLSEHDNGITNFHFELTAHLIDREMLDFLRTVRKGLFQFEIGVQSTNTTTINEIRRSTDTACLLEICREIDSYKNIHLHLDLIAGLPDEGLDSFGNGFDEVMSIRPQQMQMGFLKILKGSYMASQTEKYQLVYSDKAPFQVITTKWMNYDEMLLLKDMEEVVEIYYNSGRFASQLEFMMQKEPSLFRFFLDFGQYYIENNYHLAPHAQEEQHTILKDFYLSCSAENESNFLFLQNLCLYDICIHDKPKKLPSWISLQTNQHHKEDIREFYQSKFSGETGKKYHLQYFSHCVIPGVDFGKPMEISLLFDYQNKDILGNAHVSHIAT